MRKLLVSLVLSFILASVSTARAQSINADSNNQFQWSQIGSSLATVQAYTYMYFADGATTGIVFVGVTCSGNTSPFTCIVPFPAFTPGTHALVMTASNAAGASPNSPILSFVFVVVPAAPTNLTIK